jgi:lipopolysaccharide transport system ATP-binding protein
MGQICVEKLGKGYKNYPNKWARLAEWIIPFSKPRHKLTWILNDINFSIDRGESVGIIGVNGAGKSTLLKMISGTTQPTVGEIHISGTVAALLELGLGFHPEFTGRQNVYMAGQLLGYEYDEISQLMPEIEQFAEIGAYIDQPVRTYSSGMQVRLAFSVATAKRPDVLIVDEALSVGDMPFQRKCFSRIERFCNEGMTLLFVTHDIDTVKKICSKAIFINKGRLELFDSAKNVCDEYERINFGSKKISIDEDPGMRVDQTFNASSLAYGNNKANIGRCWAENNNGIEITVIDGSSEFNFCYEVTFNENIKEPIYNMQLKTREGIVVFGTNSEFIGQEVKSVLSGDLVKVRFNVNNNLAPGFYFLTCGVKSKANKRGDDFLHRRLDVLTLKVLAYPETSVAIGLVELDAKLSLQYN